MPDAMAYTFFSTDEYSMPITSDEVFVLINSESSTSQKACAFSWSAHPTVRYDSRSSATSSACDGPPMQARFSSGTSYTSWKNSEHAMLSSGTSPLMAVTMNLSRSRVLSFLRWFFRYGDGTTNTSVS